MGTQVYYYLPGIGLGGLMSGGVIVSSNAKNNLKNLNKLIIKPFDWVCIYPEGFLSHKSNKKKSDLYCEKNNLQSNKYSLYPKTTGIEILAKNNKIKSIFSIYTHYEKLAPISKPYRLLDTSIPKNIYLNLKLTEVDSLNLTSKIIDIFKQMDKSYDNSINTNYAKYEKMDTQDDSIYCFIFQITLMIINLYLLYNYYTIQIVFIGEIIIYYGYLIYLII